MLVLVNSSVFHGFLWIVDFSYPLKIGLIQSFHPEITGAPLKSSKIPTEILIDSSGIEDE